MTKKTGLLYGLLIILTIDSIGCDCLDFPSLDSMRHTSYEYSDLVFFGELIGFDTVNLTYRFKIHEIFKGNVCDSIIVGGCFNSCSIFPKDKCNWIIYANIRENGLINIDQCLLSRSEITPQFLGVYTMPPPPSPNADKKELDEIEAYANQLKTQAKDDWLTELDLLRNK